MTTLNNQFNELVKVTLEVKQALMDDKSNIQLEVMNDLAKSPNFAHISPRFIAHINNLLIVSLAITKINWRQCKRTC